VSEDPPAWVRPPAGLCDSCGFQKLITTGRGSVFSMCERSKTDPRYPKYPPVPVGSCPGYAPGSTRAGPRPAPR
jgi:hypothetical protein